METLWILLAASVIYLALWAYFDASRQRDAYHVGRGPRDLPPNTWAALIFFFAPIAGPLYWKARQDVPLQASPRQGAPPVFESKGLNVYGWLASFLFLGGTVWLLVEKELLLAFGCLVLGVIAAFGGRTILATDRAVRFDLPAGASWEQVGFRPLPREEEQDEDDLEDRVVNLDRLPPAAPSPAAAPRSAGPPAAPPFPYGGAPAAPAYAPPRDPASYSPASASPGPPPVAAAPARPAAQTSVRISDITWAASEDDFDAGNHPPTAPGGRAASADPALFQNLGGIFAPPGSGQAPVPPVAPAPRMQPPVPPAPAFPQASPPPAAPPSFSPAIPPAQPFGAGPAGPALAPGATRPPALGGAYAAARPEPASRLVPILAALAALALLGAGIWYFATRPAAAPADPALLDETAGDPASLDPGSADSGGDPGGGDAAAAFEDGGQASEEIPEADTPAEDPGLIAAKSWMEIYIERFGPVGQSLEEIDFDGFSPSRCDGLRGHIDSIGEIPLLPDEQLQYRASACMVPMAQLPTDCDNQDKADWCTHLIDTRTCFHEMQLAIESRWGLPGLLEFQISDTEIRPTSSMTGRCIADENERRSRIVEP